MTCDHFTACPVLLTRFSKYAGIKACGQPMHFWDDVWMAALTLNGPALPLKTLFCVVRGPQPLSADSGIELVGYGPLRLT